MECVFRLLKLFLDFLELNWEIIGINIEYRDLTHDILYLLLGGFEIFSSMS